MLRFAEQNVSRKMDGEACPADGFGTRSFVPGSCSDDVHWNCQFRRNFHTLTFKKNWRMSRTKASFSHLLLSLFEGSLARKLRFHIFHLQIFREISHKSFVFTSSTVGIWKVAHCNGCVKVTWRGGRVRNTIVFCTWTSYIVLEWLHQRCDSDLSADFLSLKAGCV